DVDEHSHLHAVAGEEGELLEQLPSPRVLTGKWLEEAGELRVEEVDHRSRGQLGDAAAAGRQELGAELQRPLVEALHEPDPGVGQERPDGPVDEARMEVRDV